MLSTLVCLAAISADPSPWKILDSGTKARLRGVSVGTKSIWASGNAGTCLRSIDAGKTWKNVPPADTSTLDFRDVHAIDDQTAVLLSIGSGPLSRIYKTTDGGASWSLVHQNADPKGFLDAIAFFDARHGLAMGDPVGGRFMILSTEDGGDHWTPIPPEGMPEALPDEGAFAASGTCLTTIGDDLAWFGTGGAATARVFRSTDRGRTWTASPTPIHAGNASSGIFSIVFRDAKHGMAVGGDYKRPDEAEGNVATTDDGGLTWKGSGPSRPAGFRSALVHPPVSPRSTVVAVGPSGTDISTDDGKTWRKLGDEGFHALAIAPDRSIWAVGEPGRIAQFAFEISKKR